MSDPSSLKSIVVLDTNIFLHFQPIGQWDWSKVVPLPTRLVICSEVLRELDRIKDRGESRPKKDRARKALALAESASDGPIPLRDGVTIDLEPFEPSPEAFVGQLTTDVADDHILATAIAQQREGVSVVFLSDDTAPRIRAKKIGLTVLVPPDQFRLGDEDDPRDAEIRRLQDRLNAVGRTIPRPKLSFADGEQSIAVTVPNPEFLGNEPSSPEEALRDVRPIRWKLHSDSDVSWSESGQNVQLKSKGQNCNRFDPIVFVDYSTRDEVEEYNSAVVAFHRDYPEAYLRWQAFRELMMSVLIFRLILENSGTAPANAPDVYVYIAEKHVGRFEILTPDTMPRSPKMPTAPSMPTCAIDLAYIDFDQSSSQDDDDDDAPVLDGTSKHRSLLDRLSRPKREPRFVFFEDDANSVRFGHDKLKHGFGIEFGPFAVRRLDPTAKGCSLEYTIHADNLPEPICGELHLRFG